MENNNKIKPDAKTLISEIKKANSCTFKREEQSDSSIVYNVHIFPKKIGDQENEVKNPTTKDLFDLMLIQITKSDNVESKIDKHIDEFKAFKSEMLEFKSEMLEFKSDMLEFKSDMLEFKSDMLAFKSDMLEFKSDILSLPTIVKEFQNK